MSHVEHEADAADLRAKVAIVTVSDTRTETTDKNGAYLSERLLALGHERALYEIIPDDPAWVLAALDRALAAGADAIVVNGGTGISPRDTTFDAISGRLEKTLPGFGEIFRTLSYNEIGAAAMLSRAVAGTIAGPDGPAIVFSTPGSHAAVRLAWERLIAPQLPHILGQIRR